MDFLPIEILLKIAEFLDYKSLIRFKQTSKKNERIVTRNTRRLAKVIELISIEGGTLENSNFDILMNGVLRNFSLYKCPQNFFENTAIRTLTFSLENHLSYRKALFEDPDSILINIAKGDIFELDFTEWTNPNFTQSHHWYPYNTFQYLLLDALKPRNFTSRWGKNFALSMPKCVAESVSNRYFAPNHSVEKNQGMILYVQMNWDKIERFLEYLYRGKVEIFGPGALQSEIWLFQKTDVKIVTYLHNHFTRINDLTDLTKKLPKSSKKWILFVNFRDRERIRKNDYERIFSFKLVNKPNPNTLEHHFREYDLVYIR